MNLSRRSSFTSAIRQNLIFLTITLLLVTLTTAQNTFEGCYAIDNTLNETDTSIYQSRGRCSDTICAPKGFAVFGMTAGSQCWCGNSIPAVQVTPNSCNQQCPGYPNDTCTPSLDKQS
jgi:WSC domain